MAYRDLREFIDRLLLEKELAEISEVRQPLRILRSFQNSKDLLIPLS